MPRAPGRSQRSLADALGCSSSNTSGHVVIVMDGLKEFTLEPLRWALENTVSSGCAVTLIGAMPWLNLALSVKTWDDVWAVEIEQLSMAKEESQWKSDVKFQRLQAVVDLCRQFGVVLQKEVVMGFPLKLLVLEKITSLYPAWVVLDRHQRKNREFFAGRIRCNMVMMNENGEADMIRGHPMIDDEFTPGQSPASMVPTPQLLISDDWRQFLMDYF